MLVIFSYSKITNVSEWDDSGGWAGNNTNNAMNLHCYKQEKLFPPDEALSENKKELGDGKVGNTIG